MTPLPCHHLCEVFSDFSWPLSCPQRQDPTVQHPSLFRWVSLLPRGPGLDTFRGGQTHRVVWPGQQRQVKHQPTPTLGSQEEPQLKEQRRPSLAEPADGRGTGCWPESRGLAPCGPVGIGRNPLGAGPGTWGRRGAGFTGQVWRGEASPPDPGVQKRGVLLTLGERLPLTPARLVKCPCPHPGDKSQSRQL